MTELREDGPFTEVVEVDQTRINRVVYRGLLGGKTIREMADEASVKPEEILRRKAELLEGADVLTVQEKRILLTVQLADMAREARERASRTVDEYYAGMVNTSVAALKTYLSELARMEKADTSKVESLNQKRIQELVSLMREVVDVSVVEIAAKHGLDENDLYEVFNRRMTEAAQKRDMT